MKGCEPLPINKSSILGIKGRALYQSVSTNGTVNHQLRNTLADTRVLLESKNLKEVIPYIIWNDLWNEIGVFGPLRNRPKNTSLSIRFTRGRKIFVDFGYNAGKELSMPHPAIVLHNFSDFLVVIPTNKDDNPNLSKDIQKVVLQVPKDSNIFPQDTMISLHQIRIVAKNRIIRDLGCNVQDYIIPNDTIDHINRGFNMSTPVLSYGTNLKQAIETKITYHYSPDVFHHMLRLETKNQVLELENETLKEEIKQMKEAMSEVAAGNKQKEL
jgi:PemK-like, MazF-like toxin of type II toxin-antitoxin system